MTSAAAIILVVAAASSLILQTAKVSADSSCASNYEELRWSLVSNPGNLQRLLYTFLPPDTHTPDVVYVLYHINGTYYDTSFENTLGCYYDSSTFWELVIDSDYQYTWSNTYFLLQIGFDLFQWSTLGVASLSRSCIELVIVPICNTDEFNDNLMADELLLTLTSLLRSYALAGGGTEVVEMRDYAMNSWVSTATDDIDYALLAATIMVSISSPLFTMLIMYFLRYNLPNSFTKITLLLEVCAFLIILFILDIMSFNREDYYVQTNQLFYLSFVPVYVCLSFFINIIAIAIYAIAISCSRGCCTCTFSSCILMMFVFFISLLSPSLFLHLFWLSIALVLYPIRSIAMLILYIIGLVFLHTFLFISFYWYVRSFRARRRANQLLEVSDTDNNLQNHKTYIKCFFVTMSLFLLIPFLIAYITAVATVNIRDGDALRTFGAVLMPATISAIILYGIKKKMVKKFFGEGTQT